MSEYCSIFTAPAEEAFKLGFTASGILLLEQHLNIVVSRILLHDRPKRGKAVKLYRLGRLNTKCIMLSRRFEISQLIIAHLDYQEGQAIFPSHV